MQIFINGENRTATEGITIQGLLEDLGMNPKLVIVQQNDTILKREEFGSAAVHDGDRLELVSFVGGG